MVKNQKHYTLEFKQLSPIKVSENVTVTLKEYKALQKEKLYLKFFTLWNKRIAI